MGDPALPPEWIVGRLEQLGIEIDNGASTSAYADLGTPVNLNAVAIGIGLDDVKYDPDTFPGVVYEPEAYDGTVAVVFGNGTLFVDSAASLDVDEIIDEITAQLAELGLISEPTDGGDVSLTPSEVPVPADFAGHSGTLGDAETDDTELGSGGDAGSESTDDDTGACAECGHDLSGDERFCPECGTEVASGCPSCGHDLAGGENFCPECGTDLAAD